MLKQGQDQVSAGAEKQVRKKIIGICARFSFTNFMNVFLSKAHQGTQEAVQECPVQRERKKNTSNVVVTFFNKKNAALKTRIATT